MREIFTSRVNLIRQFLTLGFLATAAAVIGIGSGLNSMFNSPSGGGGTPSGPTSGAAPSYYQPTGQPQADTSWLNAMNQINQGVNQQTGQVEPVLNQAYQNQTSVNPSGYINAGNQAGGQYGQQAQLMAMYQQMMQQQAGTSSAGQQNLMGAGNQMWNTVQNPQSGLYNQMLQQTNDTANASTAMRGIGMSPEAAGVQNQAVNQFNNAWNNNMVQNQSTGLNAMSGAYNAAGNQGQLTGANMQSAGAFGAQQPTNTLQSGAVPFNTAQTAYGAPVAATNAYTGAMNQGVYQPYGGVQTNAMPYMNYGMNSANNAFGTGQAQASANTANSAAGMNAFLTGATNLNSAQPSWMSGMFGSGSQQQTPNYGGGTAADATSYYNAGGSVPG